MITDTLPYGFADATDLDYDFIYGVAKMTMYDYVDRIWGWDEEYQSVRFRGMYHADEWQIITVDGHYAGCLNVQYRPREIFLSNIYLLPTYQRRGIGTSVIGNLRRLGVETHRPVRLNVLASNEDAFRLYVRLGFHVVESTCEKRLMST